MAGKSATCAKRTGLFFGIGNFCRVPGFPSNRPFLPKREMLQMARLDTIFPSRTISAKISLTPCKSDHLRPIPAISSRAVFPWCVQISLN